MKNKGFGLVGVLIGVSIMLIVVSGSFYYSNNTNKTIKSTSEIENILNKAEDAGKQLEEDNKNIVNDLKETTGWRVYKSEEYGFEVSYPNNWNYELRIWNGMKEADFSDVDSGEYIASIYNPIREIGQEGSHIISRSKINIPGSNKYFDKIDFAFDAEQGGFVLIRWNAIEDFWKSGEISMRYNDNPNIEILNQMLPTFKFIDKNDTLNWKTYKNEGLGFEIKIPNDSLLVKETNDEYNRLAIFGSLKEYFSVRLRDGRGIALNEYRYLDFPIVGASMIDGNEARVFKAPNGYCDGPGCGYPFIAYSIKKNDDFYNIVFFGDTELNNIEKSILSSFKFIK